MSSAIPSGWCDLSGGRTHLLASFADPYFAIALLYK